MVTEEVNRRNIQSLFIPIVPVNPYLVFYVSRNNIVHDTIQQLLAIKDRADLKKPLKVCLYIQVGDFDCMSDI